MSTIRVITKDTATEFIERLEVGLESYLPMIYGTKTEALKHTTLVFDDQYYWLIDDMGDQSCLYLMRKADDRHALWFSFIMPSDWNARFDIFDASLPHLIQWFHDNENYRYLYGKMDVEQTPPTLLKAFLPTFIRNGFNTEYGMGMIRDGQLPVPDAQPLPEGIKHVPYAENMVDEIARLNSEVFEAQGVSFSFENAKRYIGRCVTKDLFQKSAILLQNGKNELVGFVWCEDYDGPHLGEFIVSQPYQGKGLGRYLFTEMLRFMSEYFPGQDMHLGTAREWRRAVRLYEGYDFVPCDFGINLNLRKNEAK